MGGPTVSIPFSPASPQKSLFHTSDQLTVSFTPYISPYLYPRTNIRTRDVHIFLFMMKQSQLWTRKIAPHGNPRNSREICARCFNFNIFCSHWVVHLQWNDEKKQDSVCCLKETNYYISTYFEKAQRKSGDLLQIATKSEPVVVWRSHTGGFHPKDCVNVDVGFVFLYLVALFSVAVWYYLVRLRKRLFG